MALLPSLSKVLEKVVKQQLLNFCLNNDIIPDCQFGFLPGRSTVWQLLSIIEEWHDALDQGRAVHTLFLDVSKAFDRVDHQILLSQCESIGLSGVSLNWISSYLKDRSIVTAVDGVLSTPRPISSGVPQGSVLGPLLFLIYFRSLPAAVKKCTPVMFADDTLLYETCPPGGSLSCALQEDANSTSLWANSWNTRFNASKSNSLLICRRPSVKHSSHLQPLLLSGSLVPCVTSVIHLGLTITASLTWSAHIDQLLKQVSWKLSLMKRLAFRGNLTLPVFSLMYKSLVRPCLEYASTVWDNCTTADAHSLERVQVSLARAICTKRFGSQYAYSLPKNQLLSILSWPTLSWRRRRQKLVLFWQLYNGLGPPMLSRKLPSSVMDRCGYRLRSTHSSEVPLCSSSRHLSSFFPSTCILWNSLPSSVVSAKSLSSFVNLLDNHFHADRFLFGLPK